MTFVWLVFLFSFVKSVWGFIIGLSLTFLGLAAAQEDLPLLAILMIVTGVIVVLASVAM